MSPTQMQQSAQAASDTCIRCGNDSVISYELILDGEQQVSLALCDECHGSCYDSVLDANWIEEA